MKGVKLILAIASGTRDWQLLQLLIRASCENGTEAPDLTKEIISLSATYGLELRRRMWRGSWARSRSQQ